MGALAGGRQYVRNDHASTLWSGQPTEGQMQKFKLIITLTAFAALGVASFAVAATVPGTTGPDTLVGTPQNDTIDGLAGDDNIIGLAGDDTLDGGSDDDNIQGDGGCRAAPNPYYCQTGDKDGNDKITGGSGDDTANGNGGNDVIGGESGADRLRG